MVADVKRFGLDSELKVNDHFAKKSSEYVRSHPAAFAALAVRKLVKLYRLVPYEVFSLKARLMSVVFYVPLLVLTIAGVVLSRRNWELLLPLYLTIAYITVIHMIFTSQIRYRVPLQSFMALFAAFAVAALCARLTNKRSAL
jgi:hypothetical protein